MWRVDLARTARKTLESYDRKLQERITRALLQLENNPTPAGSKKLGGKEDTYRIRVGGYRILYELLKKERIVLVTDIDKRGQAGLYD